MDLTPYTCRGFPGDFDALMRDVPVKGIDRTQTHSMIRLCDETESLLYGPDFSPTKIRYRTGSRPKLEAIANKLSVPPMVWVRDNVRHPNFAGVDLPPDRAMTEEQLIDSGLGWCNEQCRVFIALCAVMEIPARLCFLFHANGKTGHTATEIYASGKWAMFDVTFGISIILPNRSWAEARELRGPHRQLAHERYTAPLTQYYHNRKVADRRHARRRSLRIDRHLQLPHRRSQTCQMMFSPR